MEVYWVTGKGTMYVWMEEYSVKFACQRVSNITLYNIGNWNNTSIGILVIYCL